MTRPPRLAPASTASAKASAHYGVSPRPATAQSRHRHGDRGPSTSLQATSDVDVPTRDARPSGSATRSPSGQGHPAWARCARRPARRADTLPARGRPRFQRGRPRTSCSGGHGGAASQCQRTTPNGADCARRARSAPCVPRSRHQRHKALGVQTMAVDRTAATCAAKHYSWAPTRRRASRTGGISR